MAVFRWHDQVTGEEPEVSTAHCKDSGEEGGHPGWQVGSTLYSLLFLLKEIEHWRNYNTLDLLPLIEPLTVRARIWTEGIKRKHNESRAYQNTPVLVLQQMLAIFLATLWEPDLLLAYKLHTHTCGGQRTISGISLHLESGSLIYSFVGQASPGFQEVSFPSSSP